MTQLPVEGKNTVHFGFDFDTVKQRRSVGVNSMVRHSEDTNFFASQTPSSRVKAEIVSEYFALWSAKMINVVKRTEDPTVDRIHYLDLFSGPGKYEDGSLSTPLMVIRQALYKPDLRQYLQCLFNDADADNISRLKKSIAELNLNLNFPPKFRCGSVDDPFVKALATKDWARTLMFVDPYGYKGLSLELLDAALKNYGADVIFFLNYNRLSMGINNPKIAHHIEAIFGTNGAQLLKAGVALTNDKEELLLESLFGALKAKNWPFYSVFKFLSDKKDSVSHFLVMVSKHQRAFDYMQSVMSKKSSSVDQFGFYNFTFEPKAFQTVLVMQSPAEVLSNDIHTVFTGKRKTLNEIYWEHGPGKTFIRANYVAAVWLLYDKRLIEFQPKPPRSRTECGDKTTIVFL